jgi:dUTP pyrophosphatase
MILEFQRTDPRAKIPLRATEGSAGYDLYALLDEPAVIRPGERVRIGTGIALSIPSPEFAVFVYARSGLATKQGIIPANCVGVIDSDYRGEILVTLTNMGKEPYTVTPFERIAQMILAPVCLPELREVAELDATGRGAGGFGSTGK